MHESPGSAPCSEEIDDQIKCLRVKNRRSLKVFSSRRRPGKHEDTGADDGPDTQRGQRPWAQSLTEPVFRVVRFRD